MRGYSAERKVAVLRKLLPPRSLSVRELAREEGISDVTLYHWRKQAIARGEMGVMEKRAPETWSGEAKLAVVVETAPLSEVELSQYCRAADINAATAGRRGAGPCGQAAHP